MASEERTADDLNPSHAQLLLSETEISLSRKGSQMIQRDLQTYRVQLKA